MLISAMVLCFKVFPRSLATPYLVTIMSTSFWDVLTTAPGVRMGLMRLIVPPFAVDGNASAVAELICESDPILCAISSGGHLFQGIFFFVSHSVHMSLIYLMHLIYTLFKQARFITRSWYIQLLAHNF